jgi:PAS domain S-box-containing protein
VAESLLSADGDRDGDRLLAEALGDVSAALGSTLELDDVLDLILDRAARVVPYSAGTVLLIEDDQLEVVRARGYDDSMLGVRFPLSPITRRIVDTHQPFVVEDTLQSQDWIVTEEGKDIRSAAVVGIHADGQVVGFINLDRHETGSFSLQQAGALQVFADQAGNAIRNARLYREAEAARHDAEEAAAAADIATKQLGLALEELRSTDTIIERWTIDGTIVDLNQYGLDLFGFSAEEVIGKPSTETFMPRPGDDRERLLANPGQSVDSEIECRRSDGTPIWVAWRNSSKVDDDNNITEIVSIGIDITERRQTEVQLKETLAEMRDQRRLTRVLADISAELTVQRDVDDLLDFIINRISTFVVGASVSVLLIEHGMAEVVRTSRGEERLLGGRLAVSDTVTLREASETRRPYVIADTQAADSEWVPSDETAATRSNLTAPIMLNDDVIGFLSLSSDQPNAFPPALFEPLQTFSNQVGVAIHNARMFAESETARSAEREERFLAEALGEVSAALNSTLELDDVLDLILDRTARVVPFDTGAILMFDGDHAEVTKAKGFTGSIVGFRLPLSEARNLELVATTGQPSFINDTHSSPDWITNPENEHIRSDMTVAIRAGGRVVGAIAVDSDHVNAFTIEELKRLEAFAEQAGNAVRNANLYEESRAARDESDKLLRAMLPGQIAEELKATGRVRARRLEDVAVLFADIVGFTKYSDSHDPEDVLESLTEMMESFEEISRTHGLEKLKTIGDSYMAAAGLLAPTLNPDLQCVKAGLDMIAACADLESEWTVRIGVNSGELVAGVLGREKFLFDIWGDTVNTASRVESNGVPGKVSVSRGSWDRICLRLLGPLAFTADRPIGRCLVHQPLRT